METGKIKIMSTNCIIRGSLINETYTVFTAWNFAQSRKENFDELLKNNLIEARSFERLQDIAQVLSRRFDPMGPDRALVTLTKSGCDIEEWKPILLWHMTRNEFLVKDFLTRWLFSAFYHSNSNGIRNEDLYMYLCNIGEQSDVIKAAWTMDTFRRVASALLKMAVDFGLLKGRSIREFVPYHLPERSFVYLLHAMIDKYKCPKEVISASDWQIFQLYPSAVEKKLIKLHKQGTLKYEVADKFVNLSLPCKSAVEFAEKMWRNAPEENLA